jgi:RNA polymerase sigma-70 factor (ECF subfamily)
MSKKPSQAELEARVIEFNQQAMPYLPNLYRLALRKTQNPTEADDLVQETLQRAFMYWKQYEQGTNVLAWMGKIMENLGKNRIGKLARNPFKSSIDQFEEWQIGSASSLTATSASSAESVALENLPADVVKQALDSLEKNRRMVVYYAIVEGMSYKEIAETMGSKLGTVMSRLHRGKNELREKLRDYAKQEGYLTDEVEVFDE